MLSSSFLTYLTGTITLTMRKKNFKLKKLKSPKAKTIRIEHKKERKNTSSVKLKNPKFSRKIAEKFLFLSALYMILGFIGRKETD